MFNVKILKLKDLIKYLVIIIIGIFAIILLLKLSTKQVSTTTLSKTIPTVFSSLEEENKNQENEEKQKEETTSQNKATIELNKIIGKQIPVINSIEDNEDDAEIIAKESENQDITNQTANIGTTDVISTASIQNIQEIPTALPTEIVTREPLSDSYNTQYGNVKIKNQTEYELTEEMLKPDIELTNRNIIIYHTHTCESYTSSDTYPYEPTGTYRTQDLNYTVARVGNELEGYLKQLNFNVTHDITYHDYPAYNGSYTRSLETVNNLLANNSADIVIDLHRDAIGSREDYAPTVKIGDEYAAQIMFVIGTNNGGLWHPNWNQNFKFAIKLQQKAEEMYPGLFKPIMLTQSRYNQHVSKHANIMEVGATGNTLEQCLTSMKYLTKVINEIY